MFQLLIQPSHPECNPLAAQIKWAAYPDSNMGMSGNTMKSKMMLQTLWSSMKKKIAA